MYFYSKDGRQVGPIGADRLISLFEDGTLAANDLVRVEGTATWLAAAQVVPSLSGRSRPARAGRTHVYGSPEAAAPSAPAAAQPQIMAGGATVRVEPTPQRASSELMYDATLREHSSPFAVPNPLRTLRVEAGRQGPGSRTLPSAEYLQATAQAAMTGPVAAAAARSREAQTTGRGRDGSPQPQPAPLERSPAFAVPPRAVGVPADSPFELAALSDPLRGRVRPLVEREVRQTERVGRELFAEPPLAAAPGVAARRQPSRFGRALVAISGQRRTADGGPRYIERVTRPWLIGFALVLVLSLIGVSARSRLTVTLRGELPSPGTEIKSRAELTLGPGRAVIGSGPHSTTGTARIRLVTASELIVENTARLRLHHSESFREGVLTLKGAPESVQKTAGALQGQTILFERSGDHWEKTLRGIEQPGTEQRQRLDAAEADTRALYPQGRVWPGQSWPIDAAVLCASLGVLGSCEGDGFMIFQRFVKYKEERCAHLTYSVELTTQEAGMDLRMTLTGDLFRSIDRAINLETKGEGTFTLRGAAAETGTNGALLELTGPLQLVQTSEQGDR